MSTIRVSNIQDTAGSNNSTPAAIANGIAKAWVNFNGAGTVAIRGSYNVSSITDNGLGDYTVNFTTALADASYCVTGTATRISGGSNATFGLFSSTYPGPPATQTTSAVRVCTGGTDNTDMGTVSVAVFR